MNQSINILGALACGAAGVALTGMLYQAIGAQRDKRRFAGAGRWVEIGNGDKLYVLEKGAGGPTVLFEAGIAATNLNWFHIQEHVARFTGTASYDRAGLGWSSPCRSARTPGNIAGELHTMLERAGIPPPYVLVGHSFGGLVMRRFALLYSDEVQSVVLVDPMRCSEWPPLNPGKQAEVDRGKRLSGYAIPIARVGLARLAVTSLLCRSGRATRWLTERGGTGPRHVLGRVTEEVGKMPREIWPVVAAHWSRPSYYAGMRSHVAAVPDSVREMNSTAPIRGIPVLVLTPDKSTPLSATCLARIGDNVTQVIAPESAHWVHLDQPALVIDSIRQMVHAPSTEPEPEPVAVTA
ncbi:MAG TPA: alpha/beta hydrolase [Terracidiphilus sp.]|jgi:pimeloyl-ACP methyl ester carboxylesterase|nr:alpha/beta hydrolase [Terracidiphilus sp.]